MGTLQWDGSGKLILNEFTNASGIDHGADHTFRKLRGFGNGRTRGSISSLSNNLIFYLVSGNDAYMVQTDTGVQINGTISKQQ